MEKSPLIKSIGFALIIVVLVATKTISCNDDAQHHQQQQLEQPQQSNEDWYGKCLDQLTEWVNAQTEFSSQVSVAAQEGDKEMLAEMADLIRRKAQECEQLRSLQKAN